jgi:hypothetical protein
MDRIQSCESAQDSARAADIPFFSIEPDGPSIASTAFIASRIATTGIGLAEVYQVQ